MPRMFKKPPMKPSLKGKKVGKKEPPSFEEFEDKIMFDDDQENDDEDSDEVEPVFDLQLPDSDEEDDDEGDEDDEEEEVASEFGNRKSSYYNTDYRSKDVDDEEEEQLAKEEEAEAIKIQKKKLAGLQSADFDDEVTMEEALKTQKKTKEKKVAEVDFDEDGEIEQVKRDISKLSTEEKLDIIASDSPELLQLLEEFKTSIKQIREKLQPVLERVKQGEYPMNKGISYLQVKLQLLLNYCLNISFYLALKAEGKSVRDHPVIDHLVKIRTILEKTSPLDKKLKYQIDKLLKTAAVGNINHLQSDPRRYKPQLDSLVANKDGEEDDGEDGLYKVDKRREVHFDENETEAEKKKEEKIKKKAANSKLMKFIQQEFSERPEEMKEIGREMADLDDEENQRSRFEEDNFTRVILSKKEKAKSKNRKAFVDELEELDSFGSIAGLDKQVANDLLEKSKKSVKQIIQEVENKKKKRGQSGDDRPVKMAKVEKQNGGFGEDDGDDDDEMDMMSVGKRGINSAMESNRGLTRNRNKKFTHSKTKYRHKHEQAMKKRKGQVRTMKTQESRYGGESTGIKTNIVRSRKFQ